MFKRKVKPIVALATKDLKKDNIDYKNHNLERDAILKKFLTLFLEEFDKFWHYFDNYHINIENTNIYNSENWIDLNKLLNQIEDNKQIQFINLNHYCNSFSLNWDKIFESLNISTMNYVNKLNWILSIYDFIISNYSFFSNNVQYNNTIAISNIFDRTTRFLNNCEQYGFLYKNSIISYSEKVLNVIYLDDENFTNLYLKFIRENDFEKKHGLMFQIQGKLLWIFDKHSPVFDELKNYFNTDYLNNFAGKVQGYIRHTEQESSTHLKKWINEWKTFDINVKLKIMNNISDTLVYGACISKNYGIDPFSNKEERNKTIN
ncbi:MAG: hypothetical protein Ta2E_01710 [Mycoplasmoidaceae bacterium]|nr:MAG: hypothetical protein Ta2E_01710 [Mycoplasmoidaceae bacterium]